MGTSSVALEVLRPRFEGMLVEAHALSALPHPGIKGRLRELLVERLIRPFLPPPVIVCSGMIISRESSRTHRVQDDVIIFDPSKAPPLLSDEQSLLPLEGVVAHIEVKTRLTRRDVEKAILAAWELRDLASDLAPIALLFAFHSDLKRQSELTRLMKVLDQVGFQPRPGQASSPIQLICVADRGSWVLADKGGHEGWYFVPPDNHNHLLTFASIISNTLYRKSGEKEGIGAYLLDPDWLEGPSPECPRIIPNNDAA